MGYRLVAGSSKAPLTPISKALNVVCKSVMPYLKEIWNSKAIEIPDVRYSDLQGKTGFIIDNTKQAADFIRSKQRPRRRRSPALKLETFDFTTLYTMLQHNALVERVSNVLEGVFNTNTQGLQGNMKRLCIRDNGTHFWGEGPRGHNKYKYAFTYAQLRSMLDALVRGSYVKFAGKVWHQKVGIPMGSNCSGYLANFLLYSYELDFLKRMIAEGNWQRARKIALDCTRYIDDLLTVAFSDFSEIRYQPGGIYPPGLKLLSTGSGANVDYMDMQVNQNARFGIHTSIFDKRLDKKYADIKVVRYPAWSPALSDACKLGIVNSQMARAHDLCSRPRDFAYSTAVVVHRMVVGNGYDEHEVCKRMRSFLTRRNNGGSLYSGMSNRRLEERIHAFLGHLHTGRITPGPNGMVIHRGVI